MNAIEALNIQRVFHANNQEIVALNGINLQIPMGKFIALKGRSGSGKTTLLNCLGGLDEPTNGRIRINEQNIHNLTDEERTEWRQKEVGFIFQSFGLLPTLSAYENVELMLRIAGFPRSERHQRTMDTLKLVGLEQWATHRPYEMSGGQQQRVAIARALANKPRVILADEATGELDTETAREILSLLNSIAKQEEVTILLATHDGLVDEYVDEVLQLVDGRIVSQNDAITAPPVLEDIPTNDGRSQSAGESETAVSKMEMMDRLFIVLSGFISLLVYMRTLAPGLLYGDSSEFQLFAHTWGIAHPTGYPVYVTITRLLDFIPINTLAWRVNFLSALAAALTMAGLYYLMRQISNNRIAGLLACLGFLLSYTFWSQAIIAEVYTMGTLWWVLMMICLWRWAKAPQQRTVLLFIAAFLASSGLGIHLYTTLIAPAAVVFVIRTARQNKLSMVKTVGVAGTAVILGLALFVTLFWVNDANDSVVSYFQTGLFASGSFWDITPSDHDTFVERLYLGVSAPQWQAAMFPGGLGFMASRLGLFFFRLLTSEFSLLILIAGGWGIRSLWHRQRELAIFWLVGFGTVLFFVINYEPGDKHIFYLPGYLLVALIAAPGLEQIIDRLSRYPRLATVLPFLLILLVGQHYWPSRLQAFAQGRGTFVVDTYPYPVEDLAEPEEIGALFANNLPEDAFLLTSWRQMYSIYYVAIVDLGRTDLRIVEAMPFGHDGSVADSLVGEIETALENGRPVFSDAPYPGLAGRFTLTPVNGIFQITAR
ncbi:MAG: ATP-binding cassette domain-containing protein [Chloroflexota bacterium]